MKTTFVDQFGVEMRTMSTIGPANFVHFFIALLLTDQVVGLKIYTLIQPFCFFGDHLLETRSEPLANRGNASVNLGQGIAQEGLAELLVLEFAGQLNDNAFRR